MFVVHYNLIIIFNDFYSIPKVSYSYTHAFKFKYNMKHANILMNIYNIKITADGKITSKWLYKN
jgi:hypothetical protein